MFRNQYRLGNFVFAVDTPTEMTMPTVFGAFACENARPDVVLSGEDPAGKKPIIPWLLDDLGLRKLMLENGSFVLHASYVVRQGKALLFTAPSGTGKSTQAALWEKFRGAQIINGDRALIQKTPNGFTANGIFYSGSSGVCLNQTAPIEAVVVLERGNAEIRRIGGVEIVREVLPECAYNTENPQEIALVSELLSELAAEVPFFRLSATMDEQSVTAVENALRG